MKKQKNIEAIRKGILGELIMWEHLSNNQNKFKSAPLIDLKPVVGADIFLDEMKIDVKTIPPEKNYFYVNKSAHDNQLKDITHYTFVHIISRESAEINTIPKSDVDRWEVKKSKYTEVYYKKI